MIKKTAYSYVRMSSDLQLKGTSLKRQLDAARKYADENNLALEERDFQDLGVSGFKGANLSEGALGDFKTLLKDGKIPKGCVLLVENLDRLSRQHPLIALNEFNELLALGVEIHTLFDRQIYTAANMADIAKILTSIITMARAHEESVTKSRRGKANWELKRQNIEKRILTKTCPQWLEPKTDNTGFNVIKSHAETVTHIFDLYTKKQMGVFSITRYLNSNLKKYPSISRRVSPGTTRGWHMSYITKILRNPAVIGEFQPHVYTEQGRVKVGEPISYYPPIIQKEQFDAAQYLLQSKSKKGGGRKGKGFTNPFTKRLKCGFCKGHVHLFNKGPGPKGGHYLQCANAKQKKGCYCAAWNFHDFQDAFFDFFKEADLSALIYQHTNKDRLAELQQQILAESAKIQKAQQAFDVLTDGMMSIESKELAVQKINNLTMLMKESEAIIEKSRFEIADLNAIRNPEDTQTNLLKLKASILSTSPDGEVARRVIHEEISQSLKSIDLYTYSGNYDPGLALEQMSLHIERFAFKTDKIEELKEKIGSLKGYNFYSQMSRFMVLNFKNGDVRITIPKIYKSLSHKKHDAAANIIIDELKKGLIGAIF